MSTQTFEGTPCGECGAALTQYGTDPGPLDLECPNGHTLYVPATAEARSRIAALRSIVASGGARRVDGYVVDITTAALLVAVFEAFKKNESREKFGRVPLPVLVDFAWKNVK